ncbi:hypothetical protein EYF80_049611 [Liparis tanakae]|uniref:Uncharacterized protein n=1 Tax=Liparis tanakae TaxID=230148 RepID=A0A4Z2FGA7_9TELE|nr:hypothetical protein EYF80_049611 [Liparis tanakae]
MGTRCKRARARSGTQSCRCGGACFKRSQRESAQERKIIINSMLLGTMTAQPHGPTHKPQCFMRPVITSWPMRTEMELKGPKNTETTRDNGDDVMQAKRGKHSPALSWT